MLRYVRMLRVPVITPPLHLARVKVLLLVMRRYLIGRAVTLVTHGVVVLLTLMMDVRVRMGMVIV